MSKQHNVLAETFAACWKDEAFKARFLANPKAVLAEQGIEVPDGIDVNVVENSDNCVHITLPAPPNNMEQLTDQVLQESAGGGITGVRDNPICEDNSARLANLMEINLFRE